MDGLPISFYGQVFFYLPHQLFALEGLGDIVGYAAGVHLSFTFIRAYFLNIKLARLSDDFINFDA